MEIPLYQVDAFTNRVFRGNPAAVCPLDGWLDDALMQSIAAENNLSETAFFVELDSGGFELRWFTPVAEIDLCGHATLATAHVVFNELERKGRDDPEQATFHTKSGDLVVTKAGKYLRMDFPARPAGPVQAPEDLIQALAEQPSHVLASEHDFLAVYETEEQVRALSPDLAALGRVGKECVCVTAPGNETDFVSRVFAPAVGIPEDPVTGALHCTLTPYWSGRLGKKRLVARQVSWRGGELICEDLGHRVAMYGQCALFMRGAIIID